MQKPPQLGTALGGEPGDVERLLHSARRFGARCFGWRWHWYRWRRWLK